MKIILVDDEQWIVTGLAKILGKRFPQHELLRSTDPDEALASMQSSLPDLLITDIRMDQMDGMTLITKARELGLRYYAVLTGVDEIPLLQEGIRLHLMDYLIKPVNKEELFALVNRVEREMNAQHKQQALKQLQEIAQYGATPTDACDQLAYQSVIITDFSPDAPDGPQGCDRIDVDHGGKRLTLYFSESPFQEQVCPNNARCHPFDAAQLYAAVCAYCGDDSNDQQVLSHMLRSGDQEGLAKQLKRFLEQSDCPPDALIAVCTGARRRLTVWEACRLAAWTLKDEGMGAISALINLSPCINTSCDAVNTILAWVDVHYAEDISLSGASAKVYLQPNYFTTLFKKETGIGFVQYLNQKRVDAACRELLQRGESPLSDVAQRAGFTSLRHFFNTFKRFTGVTPGEFRQQAEQNGFVN